MATKGRRGELPIVSMNVRQGDGFAEGRKRVFGA